MAERLVLHIGVQKSGTTYLQQMMQDRASDLAKMNVLYPVPRGKRAKTSRVNHHELATYGLLGTEYPWVSGSRAELERGWWHKLQEQVVDWPGTAIVSAEALAVVRAEAARKVIDSFGVPENTDVIISARGLGKLLPSVWQQQVRNGRAITYDTYLSQLRSRRGAGMDAHETDWSDGHRWRSFALGRLARRWATIVGTERVVVVTNPGSPPDLLWHRFLEATNIGDTGVLPQPDSSTTIHSSITAAECQVLRAVNENLNDQCSREDIRRLNRKIIAAMRECAGRGPRLGVPPEFRDHVRTWSEEDIADLRDSGVRVIGDLDDLRYDPESEKPDATPMQIASAAGVAVKVAIEWASPQKS